MHSTQQQQQKVQVCPA